MSPTRRPRSPRLEELLVGIRSAAEGHEGAPWRTTAALMAGFVSLAFAIAEADPAAARALHAELLAWGWQGVGLREELVGVEAERVAAVLGARGRLD